MKIKDKCMTQVVSTDLKDLSLDSNTYRKGQMPELTFKSRLKSYTLAPRGSLTSTETSTAQNVEDLAQKTGN